jgi:preprotein translocase subunit SecA
MNIFKKLLGSSSGKEIKRILPIVDAIMALDEQYTKMSDAELCARTDHFKKELASGKTTDDILVPAFATVREAAWRVLGEKHYRTQLIGGVVLHQGRISEMKTGEGKTLVSTLPSYLNALTGEGVHIVTVNDYLARRDSEWMGKVHRFLGLSVGLIVHGIDQKQRKEAYAADITYGTNNEMGFDYLRDNMAIYKEHMVQRGHSFAIVDEVDSILIDEARTPLIISGQGAKSSDLYEQADRFAASLRCMRIAKTDTKEEMDDVDADYIVDEKLRSAMITAKGIKKAEQIFGVENLGDIENNTLYHHINQALKARGVMKRDIDYVVNNGKIIIVDEFTGRLMYGRRYSEGLHQAIEAKEKVKVEHESKTLATITFQNYFRLYKKLSGMTGTAKTEEEEFNAVFKLDVVEIPTNLPLIRKDHPDSIYKTERAKYNAVIEQIIQSHEKGQPVLVGTISIEKSEQLSALLKKRGIKHEVLNAKHHEKEAEIIAQAGHSGAVTIATNMAGRGTDIKLGGNVEYQARRELRKLGYAEELIAEADGHSDTNNESLLEIRSKFNELCEKYKPDISIESKAVIAAGGLFIIGTERHESRRIDNQLRGRAARQGDPGESRFYLSLEDDLMRLFSSERVIKMMNALGVDESVPIEHKILSNAIESAQASIESRNFQVRKHGLDFDDVMNLQRGIIYGQRRQVLDDGDLRSMISKMMEVYIKHLVETTFGANDYVDRVPLEELRSHVEGKIIEAGALESDDKTLNELTPDRVTNLMLDSAVKKYAQKETRYGEAVMREFERKVLLSTVDEKWMDHIDAMHELRTGIGLRAYGQIDPVMAYKREGFDMFEEMTEAIQEDTVIRLFTYEIKTQEDVRREQVARIQAAKAVGGDDTDKRGKTVKKTEKPGRNDPCPCGSGKKYKKCCGMYEE